MATLSRVFRYRIHRSSSPFPFYSDTLGLCSFPKATQEVFSPWSRSGKPSSQPLAPQPGIQLTDPWPSPLLAEVEEHGGSLCLECTGAGLLLQLNIVVRQEMFTAPETELQTCDFWRNLDMHQQPSNTTIWMYTSKS